MNFHFRQVGKPAPPRPRSPEVRIVSITASALFCVEHLGQGLVAVAGDVVLDLLRVDHAAVAQHDLLLPLEEVHVGGVGHGAAVGPLVRQPLDDPPAAEVLGDDFLGVLRA